MSNAFHRFIASLATCSHSFVGVCCSKFWGGWCLGMVTCSTRSPRGITVHRFRGEELTWRTDKRAKAQMQTIYACTIKARCQGVVPHALGAHHSIPPTVLEHEDVQDAAVCTHVSYAWRTKT